MDCESIPSCAEMGYTQDSCSGGKGVRCPFDENKFYCAGVKQLPDAPEPVVTPEDWTAECADKIAYCTAYNTECQCTACEDTYLISDGACVPECDKSADTCAAESKVFNAETCTCEACPTNYQFNSETKACEQIACDKTKVEHCTTYSSDYEPCTCQACETNYLLVDGVCKKMCTVVENCTTYDSEYDPCNCTACEDGYIFENGACVVDPCVEKCKIAYPLFAGQDNTNAAIDQIGSQALAAYAAHRFYVGDKNGDFGQGKWYLPSLGEWMYFYGTDVTKMTAGRGTTGATGNTKTLINNALNTLAGKGVNAEGLNERKSYWSSSEGNPSRDAWSFSTKQGYRNYSGKGFSNALRCSLFLKDCFNPATGGIPPKTGDVMYSDKTYGSVADYDGSKTPVGIVSSVSKNGRDVTIINLKDLTFGSSSFSDFDPDNPYGRSNNSANWAGHYDTSKNIKGIQDFDADQLLSAAQASGNCPCQLYKEENSSCNLTAETCATQGKTFNNISCACESCPRGYLFDKEINECHELCSEDIGACSEYDSEWSGCNCSVCKTGYYLSEKKDVYSSKAGCVAMFCNTIRTTNGYEPLCPVDYCKQCSDDGVCIKCARGFTLEDGGTKCAPSSDACVPGALLYDDFKCYDPDKAPSGRTPIGVIYWNFNGYRDANGRVPSDSKRFLAVSLEEAKLPWSTALEGVGQPCYKYSGDEYTKCQETGPYCDKLNGTEKMDCLINKGAEEGSAISYCRNYGVTEADKGKWYLPNLDEAKSIWDSTHVHPTCLLGYALSKYGTDFSKTQGLLTSMSYGSTDAYTASGAIIKKSTSWGVRCVLDYSEGTEGYFTSAGCFTTEADGGCSSCAKQTYKTSEDGECVPCSSEELTDNCATFNGVDCSCIECDSGYTLTSDGHCT